MADDPAKRTMYRLRGGNDRLPERMARALHTPVRLQHAARRIVQNKNRCPGHGRERPAKIGNPPDYAVVAAPAPLAAEIAYRAGLPEAQRDTLTRLKYGPATKTLLQFHRDAWRRSGKAARVRHRSRIGAVWDTSENQRGPKGMLDRARRRRRERCNPEPAENRWHRRAGRALSFFGIGPARLITSRKRQLGKRSMGARRICVLRSSFPPSARRLLTMPVGIGSFLPASIRARNVARLYERRDREQPARRRGSVCKQQILKLVAPPHHSLR